MGFALLPFWSGLAFLVSAPSLADETLAFDFTSANQVDATASTGSWDPVRARAWTALAPGGASSKIVDFGSGADGAFANGPAQTGISVVGTTITVNTDTKATFEFSSFTLGAGFTLTVTGSQPLTLRSLGAVTIAGTLSLDGAAGAAGSGGGTPAGGSGEGGGGAGGNGSPDNPTPATAGSPISASASGGAIGTNQNTGGDGEGGGGGCVGKDASAVPDADPGKSGFVDLANAGNCTSTRAVVAAALETTLVRGAGGGGGGSFLDLGPVTYKGGAGGAGGGALKISSLGAVSITGTVSLRGGAGGEAPGGGGVTAGGGGGGSGGVLWIQTYGTLGGAGALDLLGGTGGASTTLAGAATGGDGSVGIYRADTASGTQAVATVTAGSTQTVSTLSPASTGSYEVISTGLSLPTGLYTLGTPTETTGCGSTGTLTVQYEGSYDGTNFSGTVSGASIASLSGYPYVRFRATFTGADPPCLTGVSIPYTLTNVSDIGLTGGLACGRLASRGNPEGGPSRGTWGDLLLMSAMALAVLGLSLRRRLRAQSTN